METLNSNPLFKKVATTLFIVLVAFVAVKTIREIKEISHLGKMQMAPTTINVSGKGEVLATPDIATFSFTVREEASIVSKAQKMSTEKMNAILAYVKKSNVEDKDVKTLSYSIYPRYDYQNGTNYNPGKQILAAYVVSQTIEIKVRKLEDAGSLLTGIGEFGATDVSGLSFSIDKQDDLAREARDKAIVDAQVEAAKLAKALGVKLGSMTSFYESNPYPMYYAKDVMMSASAPMMAGGEGRVTPQLPSGENKVTSNVTVTYEVR
ncbi:MAG: hypothetical protein RLZZ67_256 [Candidatus Parcubacteria bacterium]|jgi:uncharacterized protein YggE